MLCPLMRPSNDLAISDGDVKYSYKECHALCSGIMQGLKTRGIGTTSIVAFRAENTLAVILTFFALFRLGAIACPLSTRLPNIHREIEALGATHVIEPAICGKSKATCELDLGTRATYLFTSGSAGKPKIAIHTLSNHIYSALGVNSYLGLSSDDAWHLSLPLWHVGGIAILFRCFLKGATVVINGVSTHASWVPTQVLRTVGKSTKHKAILVGGAHLSQNLALKASNLPIFPSYGLTEMSSTVLIKKIPVPYRRVKLEEGELLVSGPTLFQGYLGETPQMGWFRTGDLALKDFTILGRKDRLFISGGENIQPEEIENALLKIKGIRQAVVVAIPDLEFGERPVAFVDNPGACKEQLADLLPKFKHPIRYFALPSFQDKPNLTALASEARLLMQG